MVESLRENGSDRGPVTGNGIALYRFFLAANVFYHHTLYFSNDDLVRFGASSVIGFYVVSGYLNGRSLASFQRRTDSARTYFLIDRFLRMFPVHLVTALAALVVGFFLSRSATNPVQVLSNLFIAPMFLTGYNHELFGGYVMLAWTLGTEYLFYCMLPLFLVLTPRVQKGVFFGLLLAYCAFFFVGSFQHIRMHRLGWGFESNFLSIWCYQFPFLTFWFFLLGDFVRRREHRVAILAALVSVVFFGVFGYKVYAGAKPIPFAATLFVGWALCLPLVYLAEKIELRGRVGQVATFLGDLTLPLYLGHGLGRLIAGAAGKSVATFEGMLLMWTLTFFITLAMYSLDKGANAFRYSFREWYFRKFPRVE